MKKALSILTAAVMSCCVLSVTSASAATAPNYDMNLDGVIDTRDAYTLLTFYMENWAQVESTLSPEVYANCEANGDVRANGMIQASDAAIILVYTVENDLSGDVNFDGAVTASDAAYTLSYYSRNASGKINSDEMLSEIDYCVKNLSDMNDDGMVSAADAGTMLAVYVENQTAGN